MCICVSEHVCDVEAYVGGAWCVSVFGAYLCACACLCMCVSVVCVPVCLSVYERVCICVLAGWCVCAGVWCVLGDGGGRFCK